MPVLQLIAPSGNPHDRNAVARGVDYFTRQGWRVTGQACALRQMQRFAGTDEERLHEINSLTRFINPTEELKSKRPDLVMALRGGYGLSRLLDRIDYAEIAKAKAETEFEKYRVIQDRLFMSDFDKYMLELEENAKK